MATAGPNAGGTFASTDEDQVSDSAWGATGNAAASDDVYAATTMNSELFTDRLDCTNFSLSVPVGATVDGITVVVHRKTSTTVRSPRDYRVQLIVGGLLSGTNKATATVWPTTEGTATYGGATDKWGLTPTQAEVTASTFGVAISGQRNAGKGSAVLSIDYVTIAVDYTAAGGVKRLLMMGVGT